MTNNELPEWMTEGTLTPEAARTALAIPLPSVPEGGLHRLPTFGWAWKGDGADLAR
jgi:hypothetical protein